MKKTAIIMLTLGFFLAFSRPALALEPLQLRPSIKLDLANALAAKCAKIQEKIATRTGKYDENKDRRYNAYQNLSERLDKFVARLKDRGYDVAKLENDVTTLKGKIEKFHNDYAAYMAKLGETKEYACGHSDGEFKGKLQEARELLKTVRGDMKDIREFYRNTIKSDLKAIRAQNPTKSE